MISGVERGGFTTEPFVAGGLVAVFALTRGGATLARRVAEITGGELWLPESLGDPGGVAGGASPAPAVVRRFSRVGPALREAFGARRALVCVMATGVVVRSLASVLESKHVDPAVLVMDEAGRFVVPLLSGHLGGANALAARIADGLGAQAVITTSSDVQGRLGPDLLAASFGARVDDRRRLLPLAAALANGETVGLWVDPAEVGGATVTRLEGLAGYQVHALRDVPRDGIAGPAVLLTARVAARDEIPLAGEEAGAVAGPPVAAPPVLIDDAVLWLVPRTVFAGVGCKRGAKAAGLGDAVRDALRESGLHPGSLRALATAEAKREEAGLAEVAAALGVPLLVALDEEIRSTIVAHGLAENPWVQKNIGVGGVCEPAALWAAGEGATLILPKRAGRGVTVALARVDTGAAPALRPASPATANESATGDGTGGARR
jgi:cobalt-precorrin 5A hydrolase